MGIGAKLAFAFLTVILVAVLGNVGYSLYLEYQQSHEAAAQKVDRTMNKILTDFAAVENSNRAIAVDLLRDPAVISAFSNKDRSAMAAALKSSISKSALIGFITIVDSSGKVFFSTDTPNKFGYSVREKGNGVDFVLQKNDRWEGACALSPTDGLALSNMLPIRLNGHVDGIVIVSQPLNTEFLTGLVTKFAIQPDHLTGVDIALLSTQNNRLIAVTPNLMSISTGGPFIKELDTRGVLAIGQLGSESFLSKLFHLPSTGFEKGGRWWRTLPSDDTANAPVALFLVTTPVPEFGAKFASVLLLASTCGAVALVFGLVFSAGISKGVNEPLQFLIERTSELASNKTSLPPLEGLSGDWLELGEIIDTAVSSMRTSVQSLRIQLGKQTHEVESRSKLADDTVNQLDSLNRQFSNQSKQLSDSTRQTNNANRQSILLQHKLDAVLQVSTEGFLILDQFGNILSANPVFLNWIGCPEGEIAGRLCFDLVKRPGEPRNEDRQGQAFARHGGNPQELINQFYPEGVIYHRHENKAVEVLAHLQPVMSDDASSQGYIMVLRDKSLRSEIAQLRGEIVAMLSDSIRVPLASAEQRWLSILANTANMMHPSVGQHLAELHSQYEQLLGLVDSLLMIYGGFVPPPPREPIIVTRLVSECLERVAHLARDRQLALDYKSVTGLPNIQGNREALIGILIQILEKMINVTAPGGRVRVESTAQSQQIRIGVASSGPAITDAEVAEMFDGFIEGKHSDIDYSGRLSMYLTRNNVERLGGKIWAESGGRGTSIYFTLPMQ